MSPEAVRPTKRRSELASMAWVGGVFVLMFALIPSRPMSALEEWAYMGPTMLLVALGPFVAKRIFGRNQPNRVEKQKVDLPDADELDYRHWLRERENPSRGRRSNDILGGGEPLGVVVLVILAWLFIRAC